MPVVFLGTNCIALLARGVRYIRVVFRYNFMCVEVAVCSLLLSQLSEVFTNMYNV